MTTIIKKTIGTGRDFTTLRTFAPWLATQKLKTDDLIVIAEVWEDQLPYGYTTELYPADHGLDNYCVIRPPLGMSVNELQPGDPFHYGTAGIELNLVIGRYLSPRPGVILEGFRINITGNAADDTSGGYAVLLGKRGGSVFVRNPEVRFCRFRTTQTGAMTRIISTGEYSYGGNIHDNLFVHAAGNAITASLNYSTTFERNTIVRTGSAKGYPGTTGYDNVLRDNLYIGCGATPASTLNTGVTSRIITNNVTDTPMTTPHAGFTVVEEGWLVEDPTTDVRPKLNSAAIAKASAAGVRTKDMLGRYRGNFPDIGAYQRMLQALPALATAKITSQTIKDQNITVKGTITGEAITGTAWLTQGGVKVEGSDKAVTISSGNFEVVFQYLQGGNYDAPVVKFTNDAGTGAAATDGQAFTITTAVMPTGAIQRQYLLHRKVVITGSVTNSPESGTITLKPAATANGAVQQGPFPITVANGKFTAVVPNVPYGNYLAPEIVLTNMAGTTSALAGGSAIVVVPFVAPVTPGVNYQTIGLGQMHANLAAFVAWIRARDMVVNQEQIIAYVMDDQVSGASDSLLRMEPATHSLDNYCVISPAPGCSVMDFHKTEPFDYGELGVEINFGIGTGLVLAPGMRMTGFRITVEDTVGAKDKIGISLVRVQSGKTNTNPAQFYNNRVRSKILDASNFLVSCGNTTYTTPSLAYENLFMHTAGAATTLYMSGGSFYRNTVVRQGSAIGGNIAVVRKLSSTETPTAWTIKDNAFTGTSVNPVDVGSTVSNFVASNNVVNAPITTPVAGFTVAAETNVLENLLTDFRPKAGGALIGQGSVSAQITNDIRGENRGPAPDVGAWQRDPFQPTPLATITETTLDGNTLIVKGTIQYGATSGRAWVDVDALNPNGASTLPEKVVTITGSNFEVRWPDVLPGNYSSPSLRFTNAGGEGPIAKGGSFFTILALGGNPTAPDDGPVVINPEVAITNFTQDGMKYVIEGTANLMSDPSGKLELYIDPTDNGAPIGPIALTVNAGVWKYEGVTTVYGATMRVVATAYDNPVVATTSLTVIKISGTPFLPRK